MRAARERLLDELELSDAHVVVDGHRTANSELLDQVAPDETGAADDE